MYFEEHRKSGLEDTSAFNKVYFYFHLLVVAALVFLELGVLHTWGIHFILLTLTVTELAWAIYWKKFEGKPSPLKINTLKEEFSQSSALLLPLLGFSIISGIIQSILYRQIQNVLAPLAFHYSLYLAALILSWSLASLWFRSPKGYKWLNWIQFKQKSAALILALLVWSLSWPVFWSWMMDLLTGSINPSATVIFLVRAIFCIGLVLPTGFFFGSLLPLVKKENERIPLGTHLAVNSCGNAIGILLYIAILFEVIGNFQLWGLLGLLCLIFAPSNKKLKTITAATALVLGSLTYLLTKNFSWDVGSHSHRGLYRWYHDTTQLTDVKEFKHKSSQVNYLEFNHSLNLLIMNGHHSIALRKGVPYSMTDTFMGLSSLSYVNKFDKALVIGLGTGATVMGAAEMFAHTDVVDLDTTMLRVMDYMKPVAQRLKSDKVKFTEADGLTYLRQNKQRYDLIVNNVPSPVYFAAAKLWSREALEAIYESLEDDGIFAQWFDGELDQESINIQLETSQDLFKHCDLFYLQFNFYSFVCSKGDNPLKVKAHPAKSAEIMETTPELYAEYFDSLKFTVSTIPTTPGGPTNTLNNPYMDVLVARNPPGWLLNDLTDNVAKYFKLSQQVNAEAALNSPLMDKKCRNLNSWIFHKRFNKSDEICAPIF
ncbi:hypothetical protein [Bdellovibrio sp. HCB209]|uniref:spermine/spermidine synthase domain-containing protein n=1 Tax=Bdellovibrio sp. HCB209 TaxID=3394354 RepID=UPI0039B38001